MNYLLFARTWVNSRYLCVVRFSGFCFFWFWFWVVFLIFFSCLSLFCVLWAQCCPPVSLDCQFSIAFRLHLMFIYHIKFCRVHPTTGRNRTRNFIDSGIDCIGRCKTNFNMMTAMATIPSTNKHQVITLIIHIIYFY